jgi:hypothetical protein
VTLVETLLVFVGIPLAIYSVVALLTLRENFAKTPRYRPGQDWDYPAAFWTANPAGLHDEHAAAHSVQSDSAPVRTAKGGARGGW